MTSPAAVASAPAAPAATPTLELRRVDVFYGRVQALRNVSLTVGHGEIVALIGSNGAGKTTTVRCISGLVRPAKGEVLLEGKVVNHMSAAKIAQSGVGHSPEGRRLFSRMSVRENLEMGAFSRGDRTGIKRDFQRVFDLFPRLKEREGQLAGSLSGGEQQMCAIGRALMSNPSVLLLDEPSLGLSPILVEAVFGVIREINASGITVLLIEQNAGLALDTAARAYVLETGVIKLSGPASTLKNDPAVAQAYLGM